jgi:hypothetical protein
VDPKRQVADDLLVVVGQEQVVARRRDAVGQQRRELLDGALAGGLDRMRPESDVCRA